MNTELKVILASYVLVIEGVKLEDVPTDISIEKQIKSCRLIMT